MAVLTNTKLEINEATAPDTPATGKVVLYAKTDGSFYQKNDAGTESALAPAVPVKATGAEVDTGTNDTKFATPKAIADSKLSYTDGVETLTNKTIKLTAVPSSDHTVSGTTIALTANENQAFGDVCYINADGEAQLIDADAIASMSAVVMCADATISADASGNYLLMGIARDDTWAWTVGGLIYGTVTGTTGNTLSQTAPSATDDVIQIMGVATHADRMLFNPQLIQVEHA